MRSLGLFSGLGVQIALCILAGLALGDYLDRLWDLSPLFTFLGLCLGLITGFVTLIKVLNWQKKEDERRNRS